MNAGGMYLSGHQGAERPRARALDYHGGYRRMTAREPIGENAGSRIASGDQQGRIDFVPGEKGRYFRPALGCAPHHAGAGNERELRGGLLDRHQSAADAPESYARTAIPLTVDTAPADIETVGILAVVVAEEGFDGLIQFAGEAQGDGDTGLVDARL